MPSQSLHRLAGKLYNDFRTVGLSERQHDLFDGVLSELAYIRRRTRPVDLCTCWFCVGPFDDE